MGAQDLRRVIAAGCRAIWLVWLVWASATAAAAAGCTPGAVELRSDRGMSRFSVEIADDPQERAVGLMNRPSMPAGHGMLFVYDRPQQVYFWMRNTLIPLDMIFIGPDGVVRRVHSMARPLDETTIDGGDGIFAVLEINGGLARDLGIGPGTEVRHPAFDQSLAAWPCNM